MNPIIAKRIKIERAIISRIVKDALKLNYTVSVYDGEEWCLKRSSSYKEVMQSIQSTDMDTLNIRDNQGNKIGSIWLVYGNDGYDVVADNSDNELINNLLINAQILADKFELRA